MSGEERRHVELQLNAIADEIDDLRELTVREERTMREAIEVEERRLARQERQLADEVIRLTEVVGRRQRALEKACAARVPIPDSEQERSEEELQAEIEGLLGGRIVFGENEESRADPAPFRDELTPKEYAWSIGVSEATLRRHIDRALASLHGLPFDAGDRRNTFNQPIRDILEVLSERNRRFVFSRLDLSYYHPSQIARMKEVLARPR
jgi:hypothetical protein